VFEGGGGGREKEKGGPSNLALYRVLEGPTKKEFKPAYRALKKKEKREKEKKKGETFSE